MKNGLARIDFYTPDTPLPPIPHPANRSDRKPLPDVDGRIGPLKKLTETCLELDTQKTFRVEKEKRLTEDRILNKKLKWSCFVSRVGCTCEYVYGSGKSKRCVECLEMPKVIQTMGENITKELNLQRNPPTHAHISLYTGGSELGFHADDEPLMIGGRQPTTIISESRGATYTMEFKTKEDFVDLRTGQEYGEYAKVVLTDRSIVVMSNGQ